MKIVIISDTHGLHNTLDLPTGDVLIHCGDHCCGLDPFDNAKTTRDFYEWMSEQDYKFKVATCGNHDNTIQASVFKCMGINMLLDESIEFEGLTFYGSPWTTPFYGAYNAEEKDIAKMTSGLAKCDVLVTHSPPYGILDTSSNFMHTGSISIKKLTERVQPKIHCFGHCHYHGGQQETIEGTTYINASMSNKDYTRLTNKSTVIEI